MKKRGTHGVAQSLAQGDGLGLWASRTSGPVLGLGWSSCGGSGCGQQSPYAASRHATQEEEPRHVGSKGDELRAVGDGGGIVWTQRLWDMRESGPYAVCDA
ncbi:hypothetical protein Vretimale_9547 [Volvox reticuliferus]|uniref:Uncharacterized protein n=1 Tax=Volvox reticuliferus TaxID=1737510 RepID=A0A8J4GDN5_9CHLO|nr:hypothetical protein Vretimale_9547 [Volvox reticuliferus]